jgi:hypothetical protein
MAIAPLLHFNMGGVSDISPALRALPERLGQLSSLQFGKIDRTFQLYHRGAFWRLLAALQIQLNRSPSSTPARQRFRLPGFFVVCSPVPRRDLNRPACGATLKKSTKADH